MEFGEEPTWGFVIFNKAEKQIIAKHVPQVQNSGEYMVDMMCCCLNPTFAIMNPQ